MKLFLKLFTTAFLSALLFGVCFGIFIVIENYYEINAFDNFVGGFTMGSLFSFPFYFTVGILFSYLNIWITNKVSPKKSYIFGLLMYSLLGLIVGVVLFPPGIFYIRDMLYFLGLGVLATNIFYHVLCLVNVLAKRKNFIKR
ncbi:hypothetical protein SAMN05518871_11013 [Psychrobacillus sp. OK028]|uniref:hypothetical protein n=1 Tax=Psychrobacillus sp. OK028 TaxID=1884359 RepID=UPI00088FAB61|nr:hypothetical protein [Psychrobacillus sp. OK028]SDO08264.1 hypothetical protein SAMN05518871_11013 [Psychrobacillus sp. OK028]